MWQIMKSACSSASPEDKRKHYNISQDYKTLNCIDSWDKFYKDNETEIKSKQSITEEDKVVLNQRITINTDKNQSVASKVSVIKGNIADLEIDAIVSSTNQYLSVGGLLDSSINKAAGPHLLDQCKSLGGCEIADAKITSGFDLPAKYVIHTVGPRKWFTSSSLEIPQQKLQQCYEKCLSLTKEYKLNSIAFPCISTGACGFPPRAAAHIALSTVRKFLEENDQIDRIIFCTYTAEDYALYINLMTLYFPVEN